MRGKHRVSKWLCKTVPTSTHAKRTQCTDPVLGRDFLLERFHLLLVAGLDALVLLFHVDEALLQILELCWNGFLQQVLRPAGQLLRQGELVLPIVKLALSKFGRKLSTKRALTHSRERRCAAFRPWTPPGFEHSARRVSEGIEARAETEQLHRKNERGSAIARPFSPW